MQYSFLKFMSILRSVFRAFIAARSFKEPPNIQGTSGRWILSDLTATFHQHIACSCNVRKCGTLVYRPSSDLAPLLSEALWRLRSAESVQGSVSSTQCFDEYGAESADAHINTSLDHLNQLILAQINTFLEQNSKAPFEHDQIDLENIIKQINPQLWNAVCLLTRSI